MLPKLPETYSWKLHHYEDDVVYIAIQQSARGATMSSTIRLIDAHSKDSIRKQIVESAKHLAEDLQKQNNIEKVIQGLQYG